MKNLSIIVLIITFMSFSEANAYIDPGTGSFIIQAILAIGATVVFYLGYPIRLIKRIFSKDKDKKDKDKKSS